MTAPALSEFERLVLATMVAASCSRDKAVEAVRLSRPDLSAPPRLSIAEDHRANILEKDEQAFIAKLFRGFGCKVYNLSQARASKQTPGLPDLWVVHLEAKLAFWFECKRTLGGRISNAQVEFKAECAAAGVQAYIGDRNVAAQVLVKLGLARVGDGPCGIVPFHEGR
jgi:hypothetical protein